ncbi:MAG: hypothetical protein QOF09_4441, partial [Alphaproteobacteria bacterium]|nr:hypothetical protein [Alphaproteobacteria bacterium]
MSFFRFAQRFRSLGPVSFGKDNTHGSNNRAGTLTERPCQQHTIASAGWSRHYVAQKYSFLILMLGPLLVLFGVIVVGLLFLV